MDGHGMGSIASVTAGPPWPGNVRRVMPTYLHRSPDSHRERYIGSKGAYHCFSEPAFWASDARPRPVPGEEFMTAGEAEAARIPARCWSFEGSRRRASVAGLPGAAESWWAPRPPVPGPGGRWCRPS